MCSSLGLHCWHLAFVVQGSRANADENYGVRLAVGGCHSRRLAGCAGKKTQDESALLRRSAMLATRAGMAGRPIHIPGYLSAVVGQQSQVVLCAFSTRIRKSASWVSIVSTDATKPADRISRRILRQVISTDPIASRHALALAVEVARKVHPCADVPELTCMLQEPTFLSPSVSSARTP